MKRCAAVLCAFILVCSALFLQVSAESNASKIDIYCTVNSDGDCLVSMTVNLHLESSSTDLSFPLPYGADKITVNGSSVPTTRSGSRALVSISRITGGMTGDFPVRFDYTLKNAVSVTPEKKLELVLPMLSGSALSSPCPTISPPFPPSPAPISRWASRQAWIWPSAAT